MSASARSRVAPGPKGEPILGNARGFQSDIIGTLMSGWREHGDVVRFPGIGPLFPVFLFAHPDHIKRALQDQHQQYPKTPFVNDRWRQLVGEGLICSTGDFWKQHRLVVTFLAGPDSGYLTGTMVEVDGGASIALGLARSE